MTGDEVTDRALEAIARTRALGGHPLGHLAGVAGHPSPMGTARLTLAATTGEEGGGPTQLPLLAFSVFADLVVGSAIRSHIGAGARLGTVMLSIQHRRVSAPGEVVGLGTAPPPKEGYGIAAARYTIGDEVVAHAHASAAALPPPRGRTLTLLPWERDPLPAVPSVALADLDPREVQFVENVQKARRRAAAAGTTLWNELLPFTWQACEPDRAHGELIIGPELSNRVGHLQGGALYAAAARAAAHALGEDSWDLTEGSYQFLRPGEGRMLTARSTVLRRGRSVAFVQVHQNVDDMIVGTGLFTFRATRQPKGPPISPVG